MIERDGHWLRKKLTECVALCLTPESVEAAFRLIAEET